MGPAPSFIRNVSVRLGLVISASQFIILPTRLSPLTPATKSAHLPHPTHKRGWGEPNEQTLTRRPRFLMTLSSNITASLSFPVLVVH